MIIQELNRKINPAAFIYVHSQSTTLVSPWIEKNVLKFKRPHVHRLQETI